MDELISAVRHRQLERVQELISVTDLTGCSTQSKYTLLCDAIRGGHVEIVNLLIQNGFSVDTPAPPTAGDKQDSPLNVAVKTCNSEIVQVLLNAGACINEINLSNNTPLYEAISLNCTEIVKLLLDNKADVNAKRDGHSKVLDRAVENRQGKCVKLLANRGATFSRQNYKVNSRKLNTQTPLHVAIDRAYSPAVCHLLKRGTNVNAICSCEYGEDFTPLHIACVKSNATFVSLLLTYGADVNAKAHGNVTPLHLAARNAEILEILLQNGAEVDAEDLNGKTVLYMAVENNERLSVETILKHNPDVNKRSNMRSLNAAILGVRSYKNSNLRTVNHKLIACLLQYGFTATFESEDDYSVFHKAIQYDYPILVEKFLKSCTDFSSLFQHVFGEEKCTLLHTACMWNNRGIVEYLLDKGADVNVKTAIGLPPIVVATKYNAPDVVQLLLDRDVNVDERDNEGNTLLYVAAKKGYSDIVDVILKHKPDINDPMNKKSLRTAVMSDCKARMVNSLLGYGFTVEPQDINVYRFLLEAVKKGYQEIVEELLKYTTVDHIMSLSGEIKYTPLHAAAEGIQSVIVELMIEYGMDVNAVTKSGFTPLHLVVQSTTTRHGIQDDQGRKSFNVQSECARIVDILLKNGADINLGKTTALHLAASSCCEETAKLLLDYGAILSVRDENHQTPLFEPVKRGKRRLARLFIQRGALNALNFENESDRQLLLRAAGQGFREIFEISLKLGLDIDPTDSKGCSTLKFACEKWSPQLIKLLLEYGCQFDPEDYTRNFVNIPDILRRHILKLSVAEFNKYYTITSDYDEDAEEVADRCLNEMEIMEDETIGDSNVLFCDLFINIKDTFLLAGYAKNKSIVEYIYSQDCKRLFPEYADVVKGIIWRGIVRKSLQEHGLKIFRYYCGDLPYLPDHCVEQIFKFMSDQELRSFVRNHVDLFSQEVIEEYVKEWRSEKEETVGDSE